MNDKPNWQVAHLDDSERRGRRQVSVTAERMLVVTPARPARGPHGRRPRAAT
jgi:hypothetical protein